MAFNSRRRLQSIVAHGLRPAGTRIARWTKPRSHAPALGPIVI